ncbi:MAG: hypothetical protein ACE5JJ_04900 [Nitrospinota bacterium]
MASGSLRSRQHAVSDAHAAIELFFERGWTDGLPVVPPTPELVRRMVGDWEPELSLGYVPPKNGAAAVEKLAINAVMAGCEPEHFPVVVAGVRALLDERFNLNGVQSTTHMVTPLFLVNGPIRKEAGLCSGAGCFGSGFRANATIGRALRLIMMNVGGGIPGETDKATFGHPGKFSYCAAENEEESPWEPFHVARGLRPEESAVTAYACEPPHNINIHSERDPFRLLTGVAGAMTSTAHNHYYVMGETLVVFSPEHAQSVAEGGWKRRDVQYFLWEITQLPVKRLKIGGVYGPHVEKNYWPRWVDRTDEEALVPIARAPEDILVAVAGGAGRHSLFIPGWGTRAVTQKVEMP